MTRIEAACIVSSSHPSLPGHFPGNAIVPGVVLLTEVWRAARRGFDGRLRLTGIPVAKFHAPLLPDCEFSIELVRSDDTTIRFKIVRGAVLIASGSLACSATPA